ncbi:MAG TPA: hypothetical protein VH593_09215 [Ktedonobacteraceae bacterium]|jgi:hypothetical protein
MTSKRPNTNRAPADVQSFLIFAASGFICGYLLFSGRVPLAVLRPIVLLDTCAFTTLALWCVVEWALPRIRRFWYAWLAYREDMLLADDASETEADTQEQGLLEVIGGHTSADTCYLIMRDAESRLCVLAPHDPGYEEAAHVAVTQFPHLASLFDTADDGSSIHPDDGEGTSTPVCD